MPKRVKNVASKSQKFQMLHERIFANRKQCNNNDAIQFNAEIRKRDAYGNEPDPRFNLNLKPKLRI